LSARAPLFRGLYPDPVQPHHIALTVLWISSIADYALAQRGAGASINTIRSRVQHLKQLAHNTDVQPWDMTTEGLLEWAAGQNWATETRRGRYNTYRSFWAWGKATKRCKKDAGKRLPKVKPGQANPNPCPDRIFRKAMMKASPRERLFLELANDHGLRRGEVAEVHSRDIIEDFLGHSLIVHGKGGHDRTVPLTPRMAHSLLDLGEGWAFPGDFDGHLSPRWIGRKVADLLDGDWTMHKLRHSAATRFYMNGDLPTAQKLLGHKSPATTMIYVKLPDERLRAAVLASAS
jgi:integrase/recombinase XerC